MTTIDKLNNSNVPIITFDKKLEQFKDKDLFPEKLKFVNEIISSSNLAQLIKQ
jgi:hypothetical protein